jgi:(p)ppGpp synthase/HD superfamily hydrolase
MLGRRFEEALIYALHAHAAQKRKGSEVPYVAHLLGVAALALEAGADEDQAVAALLHDAVEDQGGLARLADIRLRFGDEVAAIVSDCSDSHVEPKPPWRERKLAYIHALEAKSDATLLVSLADKIYNAEAIVTDVHAHGDSVWGRFKAGKDGTIWYYSELAERFTQRLPSPAAGRFERAVAQMKALAS